MLCGEKKKWLDSSHQAADRLNPWGNAIGFGMAWLFGYAQEQANNPAPRQQRPQQRQQAVRPPQEDVAGAFATLGLDPKKAKPADVRRIQKALGQLWHTDKGAGKAGEEKLKEINSAAAICLKHLQKK
jgi:DnaJ-class molecular chaperone